MKGNAAAGSHRAGFRVVGASLSMEECAAGHPDAKADFDNNVAHSSLVGLLLEGSPGASCTGVRRFAAWRNWDFGVLAGLQGIVTSVLLEEVTAVDSRHAGILVLKKGRATEDHEANIIGGLIRASPRNPLSTSLRPRTHNNNASQYASPSNQTGYTTSDGSLPSRCAVCRVR